MVTYTKKLAHYLKSVGSRYRVKVFCPTVTDLINSIHYNRQEGEHMACTKNHVTPFVARKNEVVYKVPFSGGKVYVGLNWRWSYVSYVSIVRLLAPLHVVI